MYSSNEISHSVYQKKKKTSQNVFLSLSLFLKRKRRFKVVSKLQQKITHMEEITTTTNLQASIFFTL